jgi:hypothetical protein
LDPPLPLAFTVWSEDRVMLLDTWLMLSLGLTGSSNLLECFDEWEVILEWLERRELRDRPGDDRPSPPAWLIESCGVICVSTSTLSRKMVLALVTLSGSGI